MKLIIDIPEEMYQNAKEDLLCGSEIIVNAIKNGTPLEQEQKTEWIPVSERLPERWSDVLVSTRDLDVDIMCNCGYRSDYIEYSNVLAWQPLPEPYQPLPEPYKEG